MYLQTESAQYKIIGNQIIRVIGTSVFTPIKILLIICNQFE